MRRLGFTRKTGFIVAILIGVMALACFSLAAYFVYSTAPTLSLFGGGNALRSSIVWNALPTPTVVKPGWTSFTNPQQINDLVRRDNLLWAATEGGVVAWDLATGDAVKFTPEHGVGSSRVSHIAAAPDGVVWAATRHGVSRYDGQQWQTFTVEDGLAANVANDLLVDQTGVVWVATDDGLSRYDGRSWRTFTSDSLLNPLPANTVRALALSSANVLWLGTNRGVAVQNGRSWRTYALDDGLSTEDITALALAPNGDVWAGSELGLDRFNGTEWEPFPLGGELAGLPLRSILPNADGSLWLGFGAAGGGIARLDGSTVTRTLPADGLPDADIRALLGDLGSSLWIGTARGATYFDGADWTPLAAPADLPSQTIHDLLSREDGLWVATAAGLSRFDGRWSHVGTTDGLANADVRAVAQAVDGTLWAAHTNPLLGLSVQQGNGRWQAITCALDTPASRRISAGALAPDGARWFATDNGISRYDGLAWRHFTTADGLPDNRVSDLQIDAAGQVWIATPRGIARFGDGQWTRQAAEAASQLAVGPGGAVWAVTEGQVARLEGDTLRLVEQPRSTIIRAITASDDALWAATPDGAARFDGRSWRFFTTEDGLPSSDVTAVARDSAGTIWASSSVGGEEIDFAFFDGAHWRSHPHKDPRAEVLANDVVSAALATPLGVWFGTSNGLSHLRDGTWTSYPDDTIFAERAVVRELAYAHGRMWAATDRGLASYDGENWEAFGGMHGQLSPGTSRLAVASNGDLWIAADNFSGGLRVFDGFNWRIVPTLSGESRAAAMVFDGNGRLWVAGERIDARQLFFGYYDPAANGWVWELPGARDFPVSVMAVGPDGNLWIGADNGQGLFVRDVSGAGLGEDVAHFSEPRRPSAITFGRDGTVWVGSEGLLYAWNGRDWSTLDVPIPFMSQISSISEAEDGSLWLATEQGVAHYANGTWETFYAPPQTPGWWGSTTAMTIRQDGAILLGTINGGVGLFTGRGFRGDRPGEWRGQTFPVTAIFNDADNQLWVGTDGEGAARLDGLRWETIAPSPALTAPLTSLGFTPDGMAWLGTQAGIVGVTDLLGRTCRFSEVAENVSAADVEPAVDGSLWFATAEQGAIHQFGGTQAPEVSWPGAPVRVVAAAPDGEMWFVNARQDWLSYTSSSGVRRTPLDRTIVTASDVTALDIAPNRTVWMGTAVGVVAFDGRTWQQYTSMDGLVADEVSYVRAAPDGTLWFATAGGLSRLTP